MHTRWAKTEGDRALSSGNKISLDSAAHPSRSAQAQLEVSAPPTLLASRRFGAVDVTRRVCGSLRRP